MFKRDRRASRIRKYSEKSYKLDDLFLPTCKIKFCGEQLQNLNFIFNNKLQKHISNTSENSLHLASSVTERLVQRMVCAAGYLDHRFASKFLICNNNQKNSNVFSKNLEYLVRLDCLSTPSIYENDWKPKYNISECDQDYPPAYARIRLQTSSYKLWSEFTNSSGYLRRDKVQARLVELLALAATKDNPNSPLQVDESMFCGVPGKVVDAATLHHILKIPSVEQVYYGPGGNVPRFPDPRDFRLAIVDEPGGIRIRVEFLSPALSNISIDVRLLVAIGIDAWPSSTDFPARIPLGHTDCLIYHQAAETGMYLVGFGVQSSAWQIRVPAAEYVLINHYGPNSTVRTILDVLYYILEEIRSNRITKTHQMSYHQILNRYTLLTTLLRELEENSSTASSDIINWSPMYLSCHILKILDKVISALKVQKQENYFFGKSNLLVNPGHLCDDDFATEGYNIKSFILKMFDESLTALNCNEEFERMSATQECEMVLLYKWKELIDGLLPPPGTRGRRFCFAGSRNRQDIAHTQYTVRQLEYIGMILKNMLCVKQRIIVCPTTSTEDILKNEDLIQESHLEDVIYILVTIMDQARDQYLKNQTNPNINKNASRIRNHYNSKTTKLVELIRKDKEMLHFDFEDDIVLVKIILKWLYKAMDHNKKILAPILRPYLNNLFSTSHAISWHLESIRQVSSKDEINALGIFAKLVNNGDISPANGLIDAVNKNWVWAKNMLTMVERNTLRIIFISGRSKVYRHILSLPSYQRENCLEGGAKTLASTGEQSEVKKLKTLPNRNYFSTLLKERISDEKDCNSTIHDILKNYSPMTLILSNLHRKGEHRGCGDIFQALTSMKKLDMIQEVTLNLPEEDRIELLQMIQNLQKMKSKKAAVRRANTVKKYKSTLGIDDVQKYTPTEESAGIRIQQNKKIGLSRARAISVAEVTTDSLIARCREARIREDNSNLFFLQDNLKIRTLIYKSESFKY